MAYKNFDNIIPKLLNKEIDGVRVSSLNMQEYVQLDVLRKRNEDFVNPWMRDFDSIQLSLTYGIYFKRHLVGSVTLYDFKEDTVSCSIGYWIDQSFTGFDIATNAIKIVCEYAFENLSLNYIQAEIQRTNTPSIFTAIKAGFRYKKVQDMVFMVNGEPKGHQIFVIGSETP